MIEQNEIIEGNQLIAEFHGWRHIPTPKGKGKGYWDFPDWKKANWDAGSFQYHSSWDWLMPMLEKISRIPLPGDGTRPAEPHETFYPYTFGMLSAEGRLMVRICANALFEADTLMEATWLAVVDFIKTNSQPLNNKG